VAVDFTDSLGNLISVEFKPNEIVRVLPFGGNFNGFIWLTDKMRFGWDSLKRQRQLFPFFSLI
jgi:NADH dehydrogenase/NADH:ubiquinone oxidoreductase subunit G